MTAPATTSAQLGRSVSEASLELVGRTVALELCSWLDPKGNAPEHRQARAVHSSLSGALRSIPVDPRAESMAKRHVVLTKDLPRIRTHMTAAINAATLDLLCEAYNAIQDADKSDVIYVVRLPEIDGVSGDTLHVKMRELPFIGDPVNMMERMLALRRRPEGAQWAAFQLFLAMEDALCAERGLSTAQSLKANPELVVNLDRDFDLIPSRQVTLWHATRRRIRWSKATSPQDISLVEDIRALMQYAGNGVPPLVISIPSDASMEDFLSTSNSFANFAYQLEVPLSWSIASSTPTQEQATRAWAEFEACGQGFKVVAAWLQCLANLNHINQKCEFCYRYRATKMRCLIHGSLASDPDGQHVGKAARFGHRIHARFVEARVSLGRIPNVANAMQVSMMIADSQLQPVIEEALFEKIHSCMAATTARLALQLRALEPLFGRHFWTVAEQLFWRLCVVASNEAIRLTGLSTAGAANGQARMELARAEELLTLKTFMKLWWSSDKVLVVPGFPTLKGLAFDPCHPSVKPGSVGDASLAEDLLQQQAWQQAESQFVSEAEMDSAEFILNAARSALSENPHITSRQLAPLINRSHTKAAQILNDLRSVA